MSLTLPAETSATQTTQGTLETQANFSDNTLQILHRTLIRLRSLAYEGTEPRTIGEMLDEREYLGILAIRSRTDGSPEQVEKFRLHLESLENKFPGFGRLATVFDRMQKQ